MLKPAKIKATNKSRTWLLLSIVCYVFFAATYLLGQYLAAEAGTADQTSAVISQELMSAAVAIPGLQLPADMVAETVNNQAAGQTGSLTVGSQTEVQEQQKPKKQSENNQQSVEQGEAEKKITEQSEVHRLKVAMSELDAYMKSAVGYLYPSIKYELNKEVDFADLQQQNSDVVGWLVCEGTAIDYPLFKDDNNDYYLYHLIDGSYSVDGSLFIDCRNKDDFADNNTVIHGHHMKSGAMFASLIEYKNQGYYDEHPVMLLLTPQDNYVIELFSAHVVATNDPVYTFSFAADEDESYQNWLQDLKQRSDFECDVMPSIDDKIITMSTCDYVFDNARYVVHGRLLRIINEANEWK